MHHVPAILRSGTCRVAATAFDALTTIPNDAYKSAARLRLGLPPQDIMPNNRYSCHIYSRQNLSLVEKNEWHYLSCMQGHGGREIQLVIIKLWLQLNDMPNLLVL